MGSEVFTEIFRAVDGWGVFGSGEARGKVLPSSKGSGLRLEYDFGSGKGFVAYRRECELRMPIAFFWKFALHGEAGGNKLELKLVGKGGQNVWRGTRECSFQAEREKVWNVTELQLPFAWGPAGGGLPGEVEAVELVVVAGGGGSGWIEVEVLDFADESPREDAQLQISDGTELLDNGIGFLRNYPKEISATKKDVEGEGWRVPVGFDKAELEIDFGRWVRMGGMILEWGRGEEPSRFLLERRDKGGNWQRMYESKNAARELQAVYLPRASCEQLRLVVFPRGGSGCVLRRVVFLPQAMDAANEFLHSVASIVRRGSFTRYWLREQGYWSPVGLPWGGKRALLEETGVVEPMEAGPVLEVFVYDGERWMGWGEDRVRFFLPAGGEPVPRVERRGRGWRLGVKVELDVENHQRILRVGWEMEWKGGGKGGGVGVMVRPWQVVPPWQSFRRMGGFRAIRWMRREEVGLTMHGMRVEFLPEPERMGVLAWDASNGVLTVAPEEMELQEWGEDLAGLLSGFAYWSIEGGGEFSARIVLGEEVVQKGSKKDKQGTFLGRWREALRGVGKISRVVPKGSLQREVLRNVRSAIGHIMLCRDGVLLKPGPRRYTRLWTRDGVVMGAALARAGRGESLEQLVGFLARHAGEDGHVPAIFDGERADKLVEHDSHGQFLWAVREACYFGRGKRLLGEVWPVVERVAEYVMGLREGEGEGRCAGLLPISVSHEGYLSHPVHAFWDDFWGARGLLAAAEIARWMRRREEAERWEGAGRGLLEATFGWMLGVKKEKGLDYLPMSVEWGDFDATSLACAVGLLDFADRFRKEELGQTFWKYLLSIRERREGRGWRNATAYEVRCVGALARMGWREEALEALEWVLQLRRPEQWNQWPEITWREERAAGHLGDLPHAWIAAEFWLAVRGMYLQEREGGELVIGSGVPEGWAREGVRVEGWRTRWGRVSFGFQKKDKKILFWFRGGRGLRGVRVVFEPPVLGGERVGWRRGEWEELDGGRSGRLLVGAWEGELEVVGM